MNQSRFNSRFTVHQYIILQEGKLRGFGGATRKVQASNMKFTRLKFKITNTLHKLAIASVIMALLSMAPLAAMADDSTPPADNTTPTTTQSTTPDPSTTTTTPDPATATTTPDPSTTTTPDPGTTPPTTTTPDPASTSNNPSNSGGSQGQQKQKGPKSPTGPQKPTGADAGTYTFDPTTGLWSNGIYSWDPATGQSAPLTPTSYSYDPTTGHWNTTQWTYDPAAGKYTSTPTPLNPAVAAALGLPTTPTGPQAMAAAVAAANSSPNGGNSNPLTGGSNFFQYFNNATVTNQQIMAALSGNASVTGNTTGGSATTGDASVMDNVVNMLNSVWALAGGNVSTFFDNIYGNVTGDLTLNPNAIAGSGSAGTGSTNSIGNTGSNSGNTITDQNGVTTTVNAQSNGTINNDLNLGALSGNAAVTDNTSGGNATSGMANVVANLMNVINSSISAGQSFVGMINIFGNLNGDILFPPGFLDSILSTGSSTQPGTTNTINGTGPNSGNTISDTNNANNTLNNTANNTIDNNITTDATSGAAKVDGNTTAGSATSGAANSNVTLFNLTGQQVVGKNAFLVMVNVLGHWVGLIMNAPQGTDSALLGGGATDTATGAGGSNSIGQTGPSSSNGITTGNNSNTTVDNTANNAINNNLNLGAQSGDATVGDNTTGGNATSGNANIAANVANISMSDLNLSNWFGVLFINVFGNWIGSVGVNTSAGDAPVAGGQGGASVVGGGPFIGFVPHQANTASISNTGAGSSNKITQDSSNQTSKTAAAGSHTDGPTSSLQASLVKSKLNPGLPLTGASLLIFLAIGGERLLALKRSKRANKVSLV